MAVEALVALMVDQLEKLLRNQEERLLGVRGEIEHVREKLNQMRRFLKDADIKQKKNGNVREWMEDIRDICFDVDDVIDILGPGQAAQGRHGFVERLKKCISDQITRYKVGKEIERIKLTIEGISRSRVSYGIREINEERPEATTSTQRLQGVNRLSVPPENIEGVTPTVDDQWTNEERTGDIDEGRHEASSSSRNLQARRRVSTPPGEPVQVGLQEGQQLIEEVPRRWDGTRDIKGRLEASSSAPCLQADRQFSALLGEPEEAIHTESQQLTKKEPSPNDGTRDIDKGRQEVSPSSQSLQDLRQFSAVLERSEVVGQNAEICTVKEQLLMADERFRVISIFGMGGSGKTALAREVYHDVKNNFDCHAFICLSQQYEMKDVLIRLITSLMSDWQSRVEIENLSEAVLGTMLRDRLSKMRFLVVIDDIWSIEAWDTLKLIVPESMAARGRVILTTRIKDVAVHAHPVSLLQMRLLNDNEGWELFMKEVFTGKNPSSACPSELEETGRKILAKCGGLPLAIVLLGGLLSRKEKTFREWSNVLKCVPRHLSERCMKILALSYWNLPYYLKPCFLYLGLFPGDCVISSDILVSLWIAEGFIKQRDSETMEDVAEDYLEELVNRNMLEVVAKKSNGLVGTCRVHVLLRDLSISEARRKDFFTINKDNGTSSSSTSVTRLAFHGNVDGYETSKSSTESLRSILYFPDSEVPLSKLLNTRPKLLRVLKIAFVDFSEVTLPKDIQVFAHLRYLEIGYSPSLGVRLPLPPSIGDLSELQTLRVRGYATLPNAIFNLKQLRHLDALGYDIDGHSRLENLRNLCTLSLSAGSWMEDGLDKLTNLRELKTIGDVSSYHKTLSDSIQKLHNLQVLDLNLLHSCPMFMPFTRHLHLYQMYLHGRIEKLPELPPNLAMLTLSGSQLQEDAISILEKLSFLEILKLNRKSYISKKMICSSGGFPRLELLILDGLSIEELIVEEGAMPVIKSVELHFLSNLSKTSLPDGVSVLVKRS